MLKFKLDKFVPYGKLIEIFVSKDNNPPNPWQEDNNFLDRLSSLGKIHGHGLVGMRYKGKRFYNLQSKKR